jgi:hypothetical protein
MTNGLPQMERTGSGDWHVDITTLPVQVRDGDSVQVVSMVSIRRIQDGSFIWWMLLPGMGTHSDLVPLIVTKLKELLGMDKQPRRILMDNGLLFKKLAAQIEVFTTEQQLPIEVIFKAPRRPHATGRIEESPGKMSRQLEKLPGYVDWRRGGSARPDVGSCLL